MTLLTAPHALLISPEAGELLQTALDGVGGRLRAVRVSTVGVQPSGATVVQYAATVERADGSTTREILAATTGSRIPDGATVLEGGGVRVGLWRWPLDPALPALAVAADPVRLADALAAAGLERTAEPEVRVRAYRPGRRAVLEVTGGGPQLFCKVVRPSAVDAMVTRHDLIAPALPVPPVLAVFPAGLLVLPEAAGTPVRTLLADGTARSGGALPGGPALDALLDRLPGAVAALPTRRRPGDHLARAEHFADVLGLTTGTRPTTLLDRLAAAPRGDHALVPVHGDFYEAQLLADGGVVTGLLDVDTAGAGHRIDEWATLLAHLSVLDGPARRWGADLLAHAERRFARAELRPRIAAAVLGLATGPFRVQQPGWADHTARRIALAERWLA